MPSREPLPASGTRSSLIGVTALGLWNIAQETPNRLAVVGLDIVAVNWHLVGPEVAYILADSGAKAFVAHERFAAVATAAADEAGLPTEARFAVGEVPGFRPLAELGAD